jgi:hypothetical protein
MPPTLPNELISHILQLATPPPDNISKRKESREVLRQCCLASKQLCAIAQPLLWEVFPVEKGKVTVLSAFPALAQHVRVLNVRQLGSVASRNRMMQVVVKMTRLSEVQLTKEGFSGPQLTKATLEALTCTPSFCVSRLWSVLTCAYP